MRCESLRFYRLGDKDSCGAIRRRRVMRKLMIVMGAVFCLSACSNSGADNDGDGKISETEASAEMAKGGATAMKPGLWEIKVSVADFIAPGVPAANLATMKTNAEKGVTTQSCMTKDQVEKPDANFFGGRQEGGCVYNKLARSGNTMSVAMTCKPGGKMVSVVTMDGTFAAESYTMKMTQKVEGTPMGAMEIIGAIEGKRLGDCPQ
jgi:hypothetical protein